MATQPALPLVDQPMIPLTQIPNDAPIPAEVPMASGVSAFGSATLWLVALIGILVIAAIVGFSIRGRSLKSPGAPTRHTT